jgi:hypothetical protein
MNSTPRSHFSQPDALFITTLTTNLKPFHSKFQMPPIYEKCVPRKGDQLLYWPNFEFLGEFWRTWQKFRRRFKDIGVWLGFWPRVCVDMIKRVVSDCWLGFRGDDLGWPRFDQSQRVWLCLTQSSALMMLIKILGRQFAKKLGRHSLPPLKRISSWDLKIQGQGRGIGFLRFLKSPRGIKHDVIICQKV